MGAGADIACTKCKKTYDIQAFRPLGVERCARRERAFALLTARNAGEDELRRVRLRMCIRCRDIARRSSSKETTVTGRLRQKWRELREVPCRDCGRADGTTQYDHQESMGHKVACVSDVTYWSCHGGVEAMVEEAKKCVPRCGYCHALQPTHDKFRRKYATWHEMPTATLKERIARHHRKYRDEKMAYVDARKMRIGACEECGRAPREGATHCFEFAHRDAATKEDSVARLCNSRVSFESSLARLDREMDRCRLLCGACHTNETRARNRVQVS